jgi:hypothetical protein
MVCRMMHHTLVQRSKNQSKNFEHTERFEREFNLVENPSPPTNAIRVQFDLGVGSFGIAAHLKKLRSGESPASGLIGSGESSAVLAGRNLRIPVDFVGYATNANSATPKEPPRSSWSTSRARCSVAPNYLLSFAMTFDTIDALDVTTASRIRKLKPPAHYEALIGHNQKSSLSTSGALLRRLDPHGLLVHPPFADRVQNKTRLSPQ